MARHSSCPNCGATVDSLTLALRATAARPTSPTGGGGQPVFTSEAREAGEGLGGLLHSLPTTSHLAVPFVGSVLLARSAYVAMEQWPGSRTGDGCRPAHGRTASSS